MCSLDIQYEIAYAPFISTSLNYLNYVRWSVDTWWIVDVAILLLLEETSLPMSFIFFLHECFNKVIKKVPLKYDCRMVVR